MLDHFNYFGYKSNKVSLSTLLLMKNEDDPIEQEKYIRIIGSLVYLTNCTRSDITYAMRKLSRFTSNLSTNHGRD